MLVGNKKYGQIRVSFDYPPIPIRTLDYSAYVDGTMDADYDYERGRYVSTTPIGHGETAEQAISDLIEQLEERE
jgi:hypothetical protein